MLRQLLDCNGTPLELMTISGSNAYAGMLEGTPYLARRFRLSKGRRAMERKGVLVVGLDALESEIASLDRRTDVWAPQEEWDAWLRGCDDWDLKITHHLLLRWYQDAIDPMKHVAEIVSTLGFRKYCEQVPMDLDD